MENKQKDTKELLQAAKRREFTERESGGDERPTLFKKVSDAHHIRVLMLIGSC